MGFGGAPKMEAAPPPPPPLPPPNPPTMASDKQSGGSTAARAARAAAAGRFQETLKTGPRGDVSQNTAGKQLLSGEK